MTKELGIAIHREISRNPLMLHGTSVEAISVLYKEKVLLPCQNGKIKGQLYFTPITINLSRTGNIPDGLRGYYTKSEAFSSAKIYAEINARTHYLERQIGFLPEWWYDAVNTKDNIQRFFRECNGYSITEAKEFVDKIWLRKGVILEPCPILFNDFPCVPGDDPTTIAVKCPNGLPQRYVRRLLPLGVIERAFLKEHL